MNHFELSRKSLIVMLLSLMALVMLPACSSTEETPTAESGGSSSDGVDCSQFTNDIDVKECEAAQQIHN
jgi:hypothetical protein